MFHLSFLLLLYHCFLLQFQFQLLYHYLCLLILIHLLLACWVCWCCLEVFPFGGHLGALVVSLYAQQSRQLQTPLHLPKHKTLKFSVKELRNVFTCGQGLGENTFYLHTVLLCIILQLNHVHTNTS